MKTLCLRCFYDLKPQYFRFTIDGIRGFAIYPYEQEFQSLLYLYKGRGDIELSSVFLDRIRFLLKVRYQGYTLVYVPSHPSHIQKRGFDHVPLIFLGIGKRICCPIIKTEDVKQSDQNKKDRRKIGRYLRLVGGNDLKGKKLLLVDDVCTTGSSLRSCVRLLKKLRPKKISILVLAKVFIRGKSP